VFHDEFFFFFSSKLWLSRWREKRRPRTSPKFFFDRAAKDVHTRNEEKALLSFRVAIIPHFINAHKI